MLVLFLMFALPAGASAARPLRTAILDPVNFTGRDPGLAFARAKATGATVVRLFLVWSAVAPRAPRDADDPADPAYRWEVLDAQIERAASRGLDPLVYISGSVGWARGTTVGLPGTWPDPGRLARFAKAAALRYSGSFRPDPDAEPLSRVRYWQVWNEPNANRELTPQFRNGRPVSPAHYRLMVNAFSAAVRAVRADNLVVAGGLGPFGHNSKDIQVVPPMQFMGELLCVSRKPPHRKICNARSNFDVWAHHPYTNGGPTHRATSAANVSIGDLPEMRRLLTAAVRAGNIVSRRTVDFWVTEFSWDTRPSDPKGVPMSLHSRWVAEALYRMWRSGVSLVTWFRLRDDPLQQSAYQSGFYFAGGAPKPSLRAFRFPFVAFADGGGVSVWGRTAAGTPGSVIVERQLGRRWSRLRTLRTDRYGIFQVRLGGPMRGSLRARLADDSDSSVPFSLTRPPDRKIYPFGCGGPIPC